MKKIAAYCRVSTDHKDQINSLENQISYFTNYIDRRHEGEITKIYSDEGISGTSVKKRQAFRDMIDDAYEHKFDMIITKEVSRFARNTLDSIDYTRRLKTHKIGVYFMLDDLFSLDEDAEYRLTILAANAQEESHKTSRRVKWGQEIIMRNGFVLGNRCFGFNLENGILTINEEEAETVRKIYKMYLEGLGVRSIAKELERMNVKSPGGLDTWENVSLGLMLENEKYMGDLVQHKSITIDYLTHDKQKNDGSVELKVCKDHHKWIISPEQFQAVQEERKRRSSMIKDKSKFSNRYAFSCKVKCSQCNSTFHRRFWNGKHERENIVWQCKENIYNGRKKENGKGCDNKGVHEIVLENLFLSKLNELIDNKDSIAEQIFSTISKSIAMKKDRSKEKARLNKELRKLEQRKVKLFELYVDNEVGKEEYIEMKKSYTSAYMELDSKLNEIDEETSEKELYTQRLSTIKKRIDCLVSCEEFSKAVCDEILDKVIVHSRDEIDFFLKVSDAPILSIPVCCSQPV